MKHWPKLMITLLGIGLFSVLLACPAAARAEESSEWDVLLKGKPEFDKAPPYPPRRKPRGGQVDKHRDRRHERAGVMEGERRGDKKHRWGTEGKRAGKDARRRRDGPRRPPVDPDELIKFLEEHEPELAEKLEELRNHEPRAFRRRLPIISKLYGPLIEDMKYDPTMAKLKVKGIRLRLRAKAAVDVLKSQDKDQHPKAEEQLHTSVADLFEVIVEQRELKYSRMQIRMTERAATMEEKADQKGKGKGKAQKKIVRFQQRLEKHKETLDAWQRDKDSIIQERVDHMRHDKKPFPWGK